jgi:hypothetical protein
VYGGISMSEYRTLTVYKSTHQKMKQIIAETDESIIALVDKLVSEEFKRVFNKEVKE